MIVNIYFVVLLLFMAYQSISGYFYFKKNKEIELEEKIKVNMYYSTIIVNLISCIIPIVIFVISKVKLSSIGFNKIKFNYDTSLNKYIVYLSYAFILIIIILSIKTIVGFFVKNTNNESINQSKLGPSEKMLQPITKKEKNLWKLVSLNTGITEEIVYRGTLIYIIGNLVGSSSLFNVVIITNIIFGLGHSYQGIKGVVKTGLIGFLLSILYVTTNSLILPMILHFFIDYVFIFTSNKEELLQNAER